MFDFILRLVPVRHDNFFTVPRFAARICGIWPETYPSYWRTCHFALALSTVMIFAIGTNSKGFTHLSDLNAAIEAFCPGIASFTTALKMALIYYHRKQWQQMLQRMSLLLTQDEQKIKIAEKFIKIACIFNFIFIIMGNGINAIFNLGPLFKTNDHILVGQQVNYELPFPVRFPGIFVKYPLYPFTYALLTVAGIMISMTYGSVDGLFVCNCMYFSSMFRLLCHDIQSTFYDNLKSGKDFTTPAENIRLRGKLADIVLRHNKIIDYCAEFTQQYTYIILMDFLTSPLIICTSILNLMLNFSNIGWGFLLYIIYTIAALMHLFVYCLGGSFIQQNSAALAYILYEIEWYKCDVQTRKMILMMLQHTQRTQTVAVPFFTLTLPAFTSIISTTASYFTVLNSFL